MRKSEGRGRLPLDLSKLQNLKVNPKQNKTKQQIAAAMEAMEICNIEERKVRDAKPWLWRRIKQRKQSETEGDEMRYELRRGIYI